MYLNRLTVESFSLALSFLPFDGHVNEILDPTVLKDFLLRRVLVEDSIECEWTHLSTFLNLMNERRTSLDQPL